MKFRIKLQPARVPVALAVLVALATLLIAGCPNGITGEITEQPPNGWAPAATVFMLDGESSANNVRITWRKWLKVNDEGATEAEAGLYRVYRNGSEIGYTIGDTWDDYGLAPGATYRYTVAAYKRGVLLAESAAATAATFTPTGTPYIKENTNKNQDILTGRTGRGEPLLFDNTYYQYTFTSAGTGSTRTVTIKEESSTDGTNFGNERTLVTLTDAKLESTLYYKVGDKVVITAHYENGSDYNLGYFYLAHVVPGTGALEEKFKGRPFEYDSRDQSIFVDDDGKAYLLSAVNTNANMAIFQLNEDWSGFAGDGPVNVIFQGQYRETPFILKHEGWYYFFSSRASGWYPSQAKYASASRLDGEWSELYNIGNRATFGSQFNHIGVYGSSYGLYGWRWGAQWSHSGTTQETNYPRLATLNFNGGFAAAEYFNKIAYYPGYDGGRLVGIQSGRKLSQGAQIIKVSSASANSTYSYVHYLTDGADMEDAGFFRGGLFPYDVTLDLKTPSTLKEINLTTYLMGGSEGAFKYKIEASADDTTYTQIVDRTTSSGNTNWYPAFVIEKVSDSTPYRYVKLTVETILNISNNDADISSWADGIYEIAVFGVN